MPGEDNDTSRLSAGEQDALQTYIAVTGQEPSEAIPLLQRSQWNVQIAITKFFDGEEPDPVQEAQEAQEAQGAMGNDAPPPPQPRVVENMMTSDIVRRPHTLEPAQRISTQFTDQHAVRPNFVLALLLTPFDLLYRLLAGSFRLFGTLFPFLPRLLNSMTLPAFQNLGGTSSGGRRPLGPKDTALRFIREFEEDYGPHNLPFLENGYNMALEKAHQDLKFLLIVLISAEHDLTSDWVRETLLAPEVVNFINDPQNEMMLWGGNVRDAEAYQVSNSLRCTKFPFAALIVHTPNVSSTAMSIVSRIPGPTSPTDFLAKLRTCVSQNKPQLDRIRSQRAEQQASRTLREQQDSAYERSLAQDRERARQRREAEAERQRAEQEAEEKRAAAEKFEKNMKQWRQWRAQSLPEEPSAEEKDAVRISIRLASGNRVIRRFAGHADIEEVYAFVECYDVLQSTEEAENDAEKTEEETAQVSEPVDFEHKYGFRLVSPMPRMVYELETGGTIRERIGRGGNILVETIEDEDESEEEQ